MKKNRKHNRVYMTLVAYSGANETQGRFFKGVKGTLRPGAILINRLTFFLFFLLTWIQIFAIFSQKKKRDFFSNLSMGKVIYRVHLWIERITKQKSVHLRWPTLWESYSKRDINLRTHGSIRISRRDPRNLKLASMRMIV